MRLLIHVEGETEETFVNEVLRDHLTPKGFHEVSARLIGNARLRHRRGGIRGWDSVRRDIIRHLRGDTTAHGTTMVDYYALPKAGSGAWPGRFEASSQSTHMKAVTVEQALAADIQTEMGDTFDRKRFIPFVIMHEFEGLLFSDCEAFSRAIGKPEFQPAFQKIREVFDTPEEINDSPLTAPSKRVEALIPRYEKALFGTLAILEISLDRIRSECPHFDGWLSLLEKLPSI
jgi:hypothetical protein